MAYRLAYTKKDMMASKRTVVLNQETQTIRVEVKGFEYMNLNFIGDHEQFGVELTCKEYGQVLQQCFITKRDKVAFPIFKYAFIDIKVFPLIMGQEEVSVNLVIY